MTMRRYNSNYNHNVVGNFAIGEYVTQEAVLDMMLMVEDFYYEQCVVMMRKSSPYTEKVSQLVGRLHQSGLLLAWETQVHFFRSLPWMVAVGTNRTDCRTQWKTRGLVKDEWSGGMCVVQE